jgi:hypothetical protein
MADRDPDLEFPTEDVLDPSDKEDDEVPTTVRYNIEAYGADYPIDGLVKRLAEGHILIPTFQREFVWSYGQASRFVESLLLGLPVPGIFLSRDLETNKLVVIDGQQRLKSLQYFYGGRLRDRVFKLRGVSEEFEGLTHDELSDEDRRRLDDSILHATIVRQIEPKEDPYQASVFMIFERINTGGTPLSPQEIRRCTYHGPFADVLEDLNKYEPWRTIYGPFSPRGKDQELILRFFALYFTITDYFRPMKLFLNKFMSQNRHLELYSQDTLRQLFEPSLRFAAEHLGSKSFRPIRALNVSLMESVLIGTAKRLEDREITDIEGYRQAFKSLTDAEDFMNMCTVGTTHETNVQERMRRAVSAFNEVV